MDKEGRTLDKNITIVRYAYGIYGGIWIALSILGILVISDYVTTQITWLYPSHPISAQIILITPMSILFLLSGILLLFTFYGLKHNKTYARFTGVIGCIIPPSTIDFFSMLAGGSQLFFVNLFFWPPSIILIIATLSFWNIIPSYTPIHITKKTIIILTLSFIVIISVLFASYLISETQKHHVLNGLSYADYEVGWGFNPPEGWIQDNNAYLTFTSPTTDNTSTPIMLSMNGAIVTTTIDIDEAYNQELERINHESMTKHTINYTIISHEKTTINAMDAYTYTLSYQGVRLNGTISPPIIQKGIRIIKGTTILSIEFLCPTKQYKTYEPVVEQSIQSIVIV